MKFAKSILLASATAFVSFAATAADLPKKSVAPAPACGFGAGFMMVPGTAHCVKIGGLFRAEYAVGSSTGFAGYGQNNYGFGSRFFLDADLRTQTSMGVARAYGRYMSTRGISSVYANPYAANAAAYQTGAAASGSTGMVEMLEAFVQFAGFQFGFDQSMFNFYNNDWNFGSAAALVGAHDRRNNGISYTASFGGGFSATLALEDGALSRTGGGTTPYTALLGGAIPADGALVNGANRMPDVVANLRAKQAWGEAQLMAAYHDVRDIGGASTGGYAVGAGAKINAGPNGSQFLLQAGYTKGAVAYINGNGLRLAVLGNAPAAAPGVRDAWGNATGGLNTTTAWSVVGGYNYIWSSSFRTALTGGYLNVDQTASVAATANIYDYKASNIALTNVWTAAPGMQLGLELFAEKLSFSANAAAPALANSTTFGATLRAQRFF